MVEERQPACPGPGRQPGGVLGGRVPPGRLRGYLLRGQLGVVDQQVGPGRQVENGVVAVITSSGLRLLPDRPAVTAP